MSSSSNSSSLARKLNEPTIQQTVQQVIEREFNLEILLKRRELSLIRRELDKGEDLLKTLRDIILYNDSDTCNTPDTRSSASKHRAALTTIEKTSNNITSNNNSNSNNSNSSNATSIATTSTSDTSTTYRARRTVRSQSYRKFNYGVPKHSQALYARRSDGTYVVVTCPTCQRSDFLNMQGFINHNQLKHENYLGSHDEAIESCGVPVNEEEVPPDHPARFRLSDSLPERLKSIVERGAAREQLKRLKPKIKVFEEHIDLSHESTNGNATTAITSVALDQVASTTSTMATTSNKNPITSSEENQPNSSVPVASPPPSSSNSITSLPSSGSRFYVKRRVTVGNISQYIPVEKRPSGKENFSHRWMVYITGPSQDPNEISTYLERVRFYIHPSYRPHDIIDVVKPPFQLLRYGWGEFPVRLQLFFSDTRNKPVDIVHMLRLDDSHSGEQTQGAERTFDIELDRNTRFNLDRSSTTVEKEETVLDRMDTDKQTSTIEETPVSVKKEMPDMNMNSSDTQVPINSNDNQSISSDKKSSNDQLDSLLHQAYQQYPLVGNKDTKQNSQNGTRRISYRLASSIDEFTNWTHGRQKSVQWQQARAIRAYLNEKEIETPSIRYVLDWCRQHQQSLLTATAATTNNNDSDNSDKSISTTTSSQPLRTGSSQAAIVSASVNYTICKFCGLPHIDRALLDTPWRIKCPMRPNEFKGARSTLNSATLATPLLEQLHRELLRATGNASDDDDIQMDNGSAITLTSDDENGDDDNNDKMDTDEEIDIDVEVIDPEWTAHNATLGISTTATDPLEHLATWSVMATMPQVTSSPMAIDWIWRVIGELHMPTYLPSALVPSRKGRHQYNRREISGGNGKEERAGRLALVRAFADTAQEQKEEQHGTSQRLALRQQASVGGVLLLGVRAFLKHILHEANQQRTLGESTEQASKLDKKAMLLPFHVYKALYQSSDQFDFLTQRHLESSNPNQNNSNGNATTNSDNKM